MTGEFSELNEIWLRILTSLIKVPIITLNLTFKGMKMGTKIGTKMISGLRKCGKLLKN